MPNTRFPKIVACGR